MQQIISALAESLRPEILQKSSRNPNDRLEEIYASSYNDIWRQKNNQKQKLCWPNVLRDGMHVTKFHFCRQISPYCLSFIQISYFCLSLDKVWMQICAENLTVLLIFSLVLQMINPKQENWCLRMNQYVHLLTCWLYFQLHPSENDFGNAVFWLPLCRWCNQRDFTFRFIQHNLQNNIWNTCKSTDSAR